MKSKKKVTKRRKPAPKRKPRFNVEGTLLRGLGHLVKGVTQVGGTMLLVMLTPEADIEAAGGDIGEAINGHRCGPECWHAIGKTPAERQAWWDEKMRMYRTSRDARAEVRKGDWWKPYQGDLSSLFEKPPGDASS